MIDKILLINLDSRKDRLDQFIIEKKNSNIIGNNYIRYRAIDGNTIDNNIINKLVTQKAYSDIINKKKTHGLYMSYGAVGLAFTYKTIFETCNEITMLLEDDIKINPMFDEILTMALNQLPKFWDILYLGWYKSKHLKIKKISNNIGEISGQINGTQGWIINPLSSKKLLNLFPLSYQIDTAIYCMKGLKKYCVLNPIITKSNSYSDIQN